MKESNYGFPLVYNPRLLSLATTAQSALSPSVIEATDIDPKTDN